MNIPLASPNIGREEQLAVGRVLRSGWISQGPKAVEFENALAEYLGCRYVRVVNSGTSAIMLALKAVGVGAHDAVVVPAFTCAASALPILALGAQPVFADIDLATFNMNWEAAERVLRPNTKAVILVHLFGRMADAAIFAERCRMRGIALIEDAALALGARRAGRCAGTLGIAGCFSFHPRKMITTGEGGAVCTDDHEIASRVESDRNYGAMVSAWDRFRENVGRLCGFQRLAFNMKMTDIQAAIGTVQLRRLPGFIAQRSRIAERYRTAFGAVPSLRFPLPPDYPEEDVHQAFVCLWAPQAPEGLVADTQLLERTSVAAHEFRCEVAAQGITISDAAQFLPELPVFRPFVKDGEPRQLFPNAYLAARLGFALPMFVPMPRSAMNRIVEAVLRAAQSAARDWM